MTHRGHGPFDLFFKESAEHFLAGLTSRQLRQSYDRDSRLGGRPTPGPARQVSTPLPPFLYGSIGYTANGFFITYGIEDAATLRVYTIGWVGPDHWS